MNANLVRAFAVVLSMVVIPNIANAYYAAHLGRFTSRDPAAQVGRIGVGASMGSRISTAYLTRDSLDPMADYDDGMNLYQYVYSMPIDVMDPDGFQGHIGFCNGQRYTKNTKGCCNGKLYSLKTISGKSQCCNGGVVGPCPPPGPSCADEGDWLDCMACCLNNGGMGLGGHAVAVGLGARVPKGRVLPGQTSTTSVWPNMCQRLRLGGKAVKIGRAVGRVGVVTTIADGAYSWGMVGSCAAGCSGSN